MANSPYGEILGGYGDVETGSGDPMLGVPNVPSLEGIGLPNIGQPLVSMGYLDEIIDTGSSIGGSIGGINIGGPGIGSIIGSFPGSGGIAIGGPGIGAISGADS
jgi:hypothetical protein